MNDEETRSRIVVGLDDAELSQAAVRWGVEKARRRGSLVEAIHARRMPALTPLAPVVVVATQNDVGQAWTVVASSERQPA